MCPQDDYVPCDQNALKTTSNQYQDPDINVDDIVYIENEEFSSCVSDDVSVEQEPIDFGEDEPVSDYGLKLTSYWSCTKKPENLIEISTSTDQNFGVSCEKKTLVSPEFSSASSQEFSGFSDDSAATLSHQNILNTLGSCGESMNALESSVDSDNLPFKIGEVKSLASAAICTMTDTELMSPVNNVECIDKDSNVVCDNSKYYRNVKPCANSLKRKPSKSSQNNRYHTSSILNRLRKSNRITVIHTEKSKHKEVPFCSLTSGSPKKKSVTQSNASRPSRTLKRKSIFSDNPGSDRCSPLKKKKIPRVKLSRCTASEDWNLTTLVTPVKTVHPQHINTSGNGEWIVFCIFLFVNY